MNSQQEKGSEVRTFTGYAAAKIVNSLLKEMGIEKSLPPQMFYNYMKKGFIETTPEDMISEEALRSWFEKYVARMNKKNNNNVQLSLFE